MILAAALLAATLSTPIVSDEVVIAAPQLVSQAAFVGPAVSIVADGRGFVVAWTARPDGFHSRVFVMRLDDAARPIAGTLRQIPSENDASMPRLAVTENGYVIAWLETRPDGLYRAADAVLDRSLALIGGPTVLIISKSVLFLAVVPPVIHVARDDQVIDYDANGTIVGFPRFTQRPDDLAPDAASFFAAAHSFTPAFHFNCMFFCGGGLPDRPAEYKIVFGRAGTLPAVITSNEENTNGSAIEFHGDLGLLAWYSNGSVRALRFLSNSTPLDALKPLNAGDYKSGKFWQDSRPSIAWDGSRWLVVWQTIAADDGRTAIRAAVISTEGLVTPVPIQDGAESERHPAVIAVSPGRLLVVYAIAGDSPVAGNDTKIGARFITFANGRTRAVR
jgi:hypothetical protein